MNKINLFMPKTEAPGNAGLNNAGIETYRNDPMISLTKEEEQNSTDGSRKKDGKSMRVEIEFHDFDLLTSDIPDIDVLKTVFEDEKNYWKGILTKDLRTVTFFENGLKLLNKKSVRVLRISDKKTTGLTGIDLESSPWSNLVINFGVSDKPSSAGGSFGIGKNAAFACSQLRLVFYSTMNTDDECATQGTLKLPSYKKNGSKYEGTGFFATKSETGEIVPVKECISLDPNYQRTEYGLDKYIVGFEEKMTSKELKEAVIKSSIANFLVAFFTDSLEVRYDDIVVNRDKLPELFEKYEDDFDKIVKEQYATLVSPDKIEHFSLFEENDVTFYVRLDPEASRKAAVVRSSGMKVFDRGNISGRIGFSAVVLLNTEKINAYFKALENPEHNKWATDRAEKPSEAVNNIRKIFGALKDVIKDMHQEDYESSVDADGLSEYLPYAYVQKTKKNRTEGLSVEVSEKKKKAKKRKTPTQTDTEQVHYQEDEHGNIDESTIQLVSVDGSEGGTGGGNGHGGDGGGFGGGFGGEGEDDGNNEATFGPEGEIKKFSEDDNGEFISKRKISNDNFSYALSQKDGEYQLRFISKKNVKSGFIEVDISGEEEAIITDIVSAEFDGKNAKVSKNKIAFSSISATEVHSMNFKLKNPGDWALEVSVNEN